MASLKRRDSIGRGREKLLRSQQRRTRSSSGARDRRGATRFGLVWEANEVERDRALNQDFVALDLDLVYRAT